MVGCFIIKSLSLHLVSATSTTRQLVIPILHVKAQLWISSALKRRTIKDSPGYTCQVCLGNKKGECGGSISQEKKREKKTQGEAGWCITTSPKSVASVTVVKTAAPQPGPSSPITCDNQCVILSSLWRRLWRCAIIYDCDNLVPSHGELKRATANPENEKIWS